MEDVAGLAHWAEHLLTRPDEGRRVRAAARLTAEANAYGAQLPLWHRFLDGFVTCASSQ